MDRFMCLIVLVGVAASQADGHCNPIGVGVDNGQLTISLGVADPIGFADTLFLNPDLECGLGSAPNNRLITDIPGFEIENMAPNSGLFIEPIGRTASGVPTPDRRWFWFWDPVTQNIDFAPHPTPLRVRSTLGFGTVELWQDALPVPAALKIADPLPSDLGVHRHFVRYELNDITAPIVGAYGIFVRLTSPTYDRSQPFLVMINSGLTESELTEAALAINYAAGSGDFDMDLDFSCDDVDLLVSEIASGANSPRFDLTADDLVNIDDLTRWLAHAGAAELPSGDAYLTGDANLDGVVDGSDFGAWNASKFTATASWCGGDFNADGSVDGSDFGIWNANKFRSALDQGFLVPEPLASTCLPSAMVIFLAYRRNLKRQRKGPIQRPNPL